MSRWIKHACVKGCASRIGCVCLICCLCLCGCAAAGQGEAKEQTSKAKESSEQEEAPSEGMPTTGISYESADDAEIDFAALQAENEDIFAWIHIPGTDIDYPVLQSVEADDYYESHDAFGQESETGALYTELANLKNMCDFNTVIHGKSAKEEDLFAELTNYTNPDFFDEHNEIYLYLDGNLLTYEVFAAYEREDTSLIRTYDFTYMAGCQEFLDDLYSTRTMGKIIKEGWEGVTPYHFLLTLTTKKDPADDKQLVVVAALIGDAAGEIDRVVIE